LSTRLGPDQVLYNGPDELLALGLQFGAHGGIGSTYNVMPKVILEIASRMASGKTAEAVATQKCANDVIEALLSVPALPAHKQALVWQGVISTATCAAPRAPLTEAQIAELRKRLDQTVVRETFVR
jgi:N-acetylneuraminate lyase